MFWNFWKTISPPNVKFLFVHFFWEPDNANEGQECHGYESQLICADGLICQDPKKPGLDVSECAPGYCKCVVPGKKKEFFSF